MPRSDAILCVGAALWDVIARAGAALAPGADVPGRVERRPGGVAANVALALAAMGGHPILLAAVGRDDRGDRLAAALARGGVDCAHLTRHAGATDSYLAIEDGAGELFAAVADCTGLEAVGIDLLRPLRDGSLARAGAPWTGQVVVDGNLPGAVIAAMAHDGLAPGARLALVPASPEKAAGLSALLGRAGVAVYLNRREAEQLCGAAFADSRAAAAALRARGVAEAVVTDGAAPVTLVRGAFSVSALPAPVATRSLTGAGDVFLAAHLLACAEGRAPEDGLRAALAASARHISREVA